MKKYFVVCFFLYFLFPSFTFASNNFATDYNVTYTIKEDANTHVNFDIVLTNLNSLHFISSYNIQLGFKNVENFFLKNQNGNLNYNIVKNNDGSSVEFKVNKGVLGKNNKINFSISFDTKDIARKSRKTWEINIPGLSNQSEYRTFNVNVFIPAFLKDPVYIKPDIGKVNGNNFQFTKDNLRESGISIAFGNEEIYKFDLSYHLQNPNLFPVSKEIALPPSTNYQDIQIDQIDPRPLNIVMDTDGNWIAQYLLAPAKKLEIKVKGKVKIYLSPKKEIISSEKLKEYLKEDPNWQTKNINIQKLAHELKTPFAIYKYVVNNLKYDFSRLTSNKPRLGAKTVLENPASSACREFTDLFIALARSANIPAREVNGFANTQNLKERPLSLIKDVLHAWPEYYDEDLETWIMVDPTWGNTTGGVDYFHTLDFNHIAFVIKGVNSNFPMPAGGYKISQKQTRDVNIEYGEDQEPLPQVLTIGEDFAKTFSSFTPIQGNILVKNTGKVVSSPQKINVQTNLLTPSSQIIDFGKIPPGGFLKIPVKLHSSSLLTNTKDTIKITLSGNSIAKTINVSPWIITKFNILGGILIVGIFILSIIIARTRHLSFPGQKR